MALGVGSDFREARELDQVCVDRAVAMALTVSVGATPEEYIYHSEDGVHIWGMQDHFREFM